MATQASGVFVGLEVGSDGVRAAGLHASRSSLRVVATHREPLSAGPDWLGDESRQAEVTAAVAKAAAAVGPRGARKAFCLPERMVLVKTFSFPPLEPQEIDDAVRREYSSLVPSTKRTEELVLSQQVIHLPSGHPDAGRVQVLASAVQPTALQSLLEHLHRYGVEVSVLGVGCLPVVHAFSLDPAVVRGDTVMFLHLSGSEARTILVSEGVVIGTIGLMHTGDVLAEQVAEAASCSLEEAQELLGFSPGQQAEARDDLVRRKIREHVVSLSEEIARFLEPRLTATGLAMPGEVVVTGTGATLPGLCDSLYHHLGVPCGVGDPFTSMGFAGEPEAGRTREETGPEFALAIGAAAKAAGTGQAEKLDLLPGSMREANLEEQEKRRTLRAFSYAAVGVAALCLVLGGIVASYGFRHQQARSRRGGADSVFIDMRRLEGENVQLERELTLLRRGIPQTRKWSAVLSGITSGLPQYAFLTEISTVKPGMSRSSRWTAGIDPQGSGEVDRAGTGFETLRVAGYAANEKLILGFVDEIESSPAVRDVRVLLLEKATLDEHSEGEPAPSSGGIPVMSFSLECDIAL